MSTNKKKVFLDANIVIATGRPPGGPELARVDDLVKAGRIAVLTTDLTLGEVAKKHIENDFKNIKDICNPHFRKLVEEVTNTQIPNIDEAQLRLKLKNKYSSSIGEMFQEMDARALSIDEVKPTEVFSDYIQGRGFFADGGGKKWQFPDAFVFECLKKEASEEEPVIIVSNDNDFVGPVNGQQNISLVKSLPDLFSELGLKMEAPEIENFLEQHDDAILKMVDEELSDWWLEGEIEDYDIHETKVTGVDVLETISFKSAEEGGSILVVGQLAVTATVDYTRPDEEMSMYDSEEKRRIYFGTVNDVTETVLNIDVSLSIAVDDNGDPATIEELHFRNDNFNYIEL